MPVVPPGSLFGFTLALVDALPNLPGQIFRDLKTSFQNPIDVAVRAPTALTAMLLMGGVIEFSEAAAWVVKHYRAIIRLVWDTASTWMHLHVSDPDRLAMTFALMLLLPAVARAWALRGKPDIVDTGWEKAATIWLEEKLEKAEGDTAKMRIFARASARPFAPYILSYAVAVSVIWAIAFCSGGSAHPSNTVAFVLFVAIMGSTLFYRSTWQTLSCVLLLVAFNYVSILVGWISARVA